MAVGITSSITGTKSYSSVLQLTEDDDTLIVLDIDNIIMVLLPRTEPPVYGKAA